MVDRLNSKSLNPTHSQIPIPLTHTPILFTSLSRPRKIAIPPHQKKKHPHRTLPRIAVPTPNSLTFPPIPQQGPGPGCGGKGASPFLTPPSPYFPDHRRIAPRGYSSPARPSAGCFSLSRERKRDWVYDGVDKEGLCVWVWGDFFPPRGARGGRSRRGDGEFLFFSGFSLIFQDADTFSGTNSKRGGSVYTYLPIYERILCLGKFFGLGGWGDFVFFLGKGDKRCCFRNQIRDFGVVEGRGVSLGLEWRKNKERTRKTEMGFFFPPNVFLICSLALINLISFFLFFRWFNLKRPCSPPSKKTGNSQSQVRGVYIGIAM